MVNVVGFEGGLLANGLGYKVWADEMLNTYAPWPSMDPNIRLNISYVFLFDFDTRNCKHRNQWCGDFEGANAAAVETLNTSLMEDLRERIQVGQYSKASELWRAIKRYCHTSQGAHLRRELYTIKMQIDEPLLTYADRCKSLAARLREECNEPEPVVSQCRSFLAGLPPTYDKAKVPALHVLDDVVAFRSSLSSKHVFDEVVSKVASKANELKAIADAKIAAKVAQQTVTQDFESRRLVTALDEVRLSGGGGGDDIDKQSAFCMFCKKDHGRLAHRCPFRLAKEKEIRKQAALAEAAALRSAAQAKPPPITNEWLFDRSEYNIHHICQNRSLLKDFRPISKDSDETAAFFEGKTYQAVGFGDVVLRCRVGFRRNVKVNTVKLVHVAYCPTFPVNYCSIIQLKNDFYANTDRKRDTFVGVLDVEKGRFDVVVCKLASSANTHQYTHLDGKPSEVLRTWGYKMDKNVWKSFIDHVDQKQYGSPYRDQLARESSELQQKAAAPASISRLQRNVSACWRLYI